MLTGSDRASRGGLLSAIGVGLWWGWVAGAVDGLAFHGTSFASAGVQLRHTVVGALPQAGISVAAGVLVWAVARRRPAGRALFDVQIAAIGVWLLMVLLLWGRQDLLADTAALSASGLAFTAAVSAMAIAFGVGLSHAVGPRLSGEIPRAFSVIAALGVLVTVASVAGIFLPAHAAPERSTGTNVLLISVDSIRADVWEEYSDEYASPELRRFLSESRRFRNAYTTWSHSLPSHASMLTGLFPFQHGAQMIPGGQLGSPARPGAPLVAERLERAGYETAAVIENPWLGPPYGLESGFQTYVNYVDTGKPGAIGTFTPVLSLGGTTAGQFVTYFNRHLPRQLHPHSRLLLDWLANRARARPFFCFLHFIEMHVPNDPPRHLIRRFGTGRFADLGGRELMRRIEAGELRPGEKADAGRQIRALSLAMLVEIDRFLAPVFKALRVQGLLDDMLVILTSDHGDDFYEKAGVYGHAHVYNAAVRVPLALHVPGDRSGSTWDQIVSVVDFAPTIYAFTGVEPPESLPGVNLLDPDALRDSDGRAVFIQGGVPGTDLQARAVVRADYKLIELSDGRLELYELRTDPAERHDLATLQPAIRDELAEQLETAFADAEPTRAIDADDLSPEVLERLRGLGYIE